MAIFNWVNALGTASEQPELQTPQKQVPACLDDLAYLPDSELLGWIGLHSRNATQSASATIVQLAVEELIRRHGGLILGLCRRHLRIDKTNAADDLFQLTFLALIQHAGKIRKRSSVSSWLCGTAYRMALKWNRQSHRNAAGQLNELLKEDASVTSDEPWKQIADQFDQLVLDEELHQLPPKYRDVLLEFYYAGQSHQQIAHTMNLSASAVDGLLKRARKLLRKRLLHRGVGCTLGTIVLSWSNQALASPNPELIANTLQLTKSWCSNPQKALELKTVQETSTLIDHSVNHSLSYGGKYLMTHFKTMTVLTLLAGGLLVVTNQFSDGPQLAATGHQGVLNTAYAYEPAASQTPSQAAELSMSEANGNSRTDATVAFEDSSGPTNPFGPSPDLTSSELVVNSYDISKSTLPESLLIEMSKFYGGQNTKGESWTYDKSKNTILLRTSPEKHSQFAEVISAMTSIQDENDQDPPSEQFNDSTAEKIEQGESSVNDDFDPTQTPEWTQIISQLKPASIDDQTWYQSILETHLTDLKELIRHKYHKPLSQLQTPEEHIQEVLSQKTDFQFYDTPLSEVADFISDLHQISVVIDRRELENMGVADDQPVSLIVKGITLKSALNLMLEPFELTYKIKNEVLTITSTYEATYSYETRVYTIKELGLEPAVAEKLIVNHMMNATDDKLMITYCSTVGDVLVIRGNKLAHDLIEETFQKISKKTQRSDITAEEVSEQQAVFHTQGGSMSGGSMSGGSMSGGSMSGGGGGGGGGFF